MDMSKYTVTFYQCGTMGIDSEDYNTRRQANGAAVEWLQSFTGALRNGHRYAGSVYRNGYAAIVDANNATEACAEVHNNKESTQ
jgi:hypothetical protein